MGETVGLGEGQGQLHCATAREGKRSARRKAFMMVTHVVVPPDFTLSRHSSRQVDLFHYTIAKLQLRVLR